MYVYIYMFVFIYPKVASTTLTMYVNVLHVYSVMDKYVDVLKGIRTHFLLRNFQLPLLTNRDYINISLQEDLSFPTVRHPFQR